MALMNAKRKGSRNEHKSIRYLEQFGYRCTRAAGSLGVWDIIGIGGHGSPFAVVLVQVKSNRWPGTIEMDILKAFPCIKGAVSREVHRWDDNARAPKVKVIE